MIYIGKTIDIYEFIEMAPKSNILKILTVLLFLWLFIILLMNVFNSGHSYYYSKVLERMERRNDTLGKRVNIPSAEGTRAQYPGDSGSQDDDPFADDKIKGMRNEQLIWN